MTQEEFADAYRKDKGTLLRYVTKREKLDENTGHEIVHRALFGRPTRTRGVSGGMYEDRHKIPREDFLKCARRYVRIEIRSRPGQIASLLQQLERRVSNVKL